MTTATRVAGPPAALIALADPLRWRIIELLGREELCVCHLVEELDVTQSLVSHHLKVLRDAGLVTGERWRYWTYYRLVPDAVADLASDLARTSESEARARTPAVLLMEAPLARRALAEFLGTMLLVAVVVGSGIAAQRLSPGDIGLQLFENAAATAAGLVAIILAVGSVSGAHLNPVVSLADRVYGGISTRDLSAYIAAQVTGACAGCMLANLMYDLSAVDWSTKTRSGGGIWLAEAVATAGLLLVVFGVVRSGRRSVAPFAVGAYIGAAYFFTSSTSFANPAVTVGRMFSNTFAGIDPASVPAFIAFQLVGAAIAVGLVRLLYPDISHGLPDLIVPHHVGVEDGTASRTSRPEEQVMNLEDKASVSAIVGRLTPEFEGVFSPATLERWVDESWQQLATTAKVWTFLPVLAERFARERLRAHAQVEGAIVSAVPEVLFVCVHNAGRSQMAAALLDWRANGSVHVRSAGSAPAGEINAAVVAAVEELGLDLSKEFPKPLADEFVRAADVVITMGCGDACPIYPGKRYLDWELEDPAGKTLEDVRPIRDEIDRRVQALLAELSTTSPSG